MWWSIAIYDLHLSDEQFWLLTLPEFANLIERHSLAEKRLDYRAALLCSVIANANRSKKTKAFKPDDFMPRVKKKQTPEEMLSVVKGLQAAWEKGVE